MRISIVQNYAKRLHVKYKLSLPVDLDRLAKKYATLTYTSIPFRIDGVSADLKVTGKRPRIFVNADMPKKRQRFTLAHEIGHVVIPWHTGTIFDSTMISESACTIDYWVMEQEANAFATELLMPTDWINGLVEENEDTISSLHRKIVKTADVSYIAACLRLIQFLPNGYVFVAVDHSGKVQYSGKSKGTIASPLSRGEILDLDNHYTYSVSKSFFETKSSIYYWFQLPTDMELPNADGSCDWQTVLKSILHDLEFDSSVKTKMTQQLNGVLGFANSLVKRNDLSKEGLYSACIQRLEGKHSLAPLTHHPDFPKFLSAKINDLIEKNS
ncbi:ImmA/IrrE family metallo-endopeptidase [Aeromonas veronii]|uniref:ImmA/IrrE family metallo-endopeptidase n=1 Tax=Aeromonas veronii TaxID=654 RepID=UPI003A1C2D31